MNSIIKRNTLLKITFFFIVSICKPVYATDSIPRKNSRLENGISWIGRSIFDERELDSSISEGSFVTVSKKLNLTFQELDVRTSKDSFIQFLVLAEVISDPWQETILDVIKMPASSRGFLLLSSSICSRKNSIEPVAAYVLAGKSGRYRVLKSWQVNLSTKKIIKVPVSEVTCMEENEDEP